MAYNEKSKENLVPFRRGNDPRRQRGRKKGSLNQGTVIKQLLAEEISPDLIFSPATRERLENMNGKTYLEAITMTLINQGLNGDSQASNILMRELRKTEDKEPKTMSAQEKQDIRITVVDSREEVDRLTELEERLKAKYGDDYDDIDDGELF